MKFSKISTAAFLAGVTTLAVTLPVQAEKRNYDLTGFSRVEVSAGLSVEVEIGPDFEVSAEAGSTRTLNRLDIRVRGDKLVVTRDTSWTVFSIFATRRDATIRVTLPELAAIEARSGSDVNVYGDYGDSLHAKVSSGAELDLTNVSGVSLRFDASSGSDLRAEGSCGELDISSSSGASIRVEALICDDVEAHGSSGSDIRAHATNTVTASASSGGGVRISGSPDEISLNESSGGNVHIN
ncbi:MAG: head GIN domain-containing protein [Paracoccaceae bacterium]